MIKVAVIFNKNKLSGKLTRFWTGCYAYHTAWVDLENNKLYDMNLIRRRKVWPTYGEKTKVVLFDAPANVTSAYLESQLETDKARYGVLDYCLFALRPIYHLFGRSTRNADGVICSEMLNNDIWACGGTTPFHPDAAPPSPCDLYRWLNNEG
jgi:hypothetical protein